MCGSGLRAVALGYQAIRNGDAQIIVAGGQESMSLAPHAAHLRNGQKMGGLELADTMIKDGLTDAFNGIHMGITAENVAREFQITREEQDRFAVASQNKAEAARKAGRFKDEITPVSVTERKGVRVVADDEYIRDGVTYEGISGMRPAFAKDGSVTAANASGLNDGAAALVLMSAKDARRAEITPLARIVSWASAGVDPKIMGTGPDPRLARGAEEGRLERRRSRSHRSQRGLRGAGLRGQQGARLGYREGQREWRRHRHRPSDRRFGRTHPRDAAATK